jgi:hypothetical protein
MFFTVHLLKQIKNKNLTNRLKYLEPEAFSNAAAGNYDKTSDHNERDPA